MCSVSSLIVIDSKNIQATSKGSDQTAGMRRLICSFVGRTYHIVGNLLSRLKCCISSGSALFAKKKKINPQINKYNIFLKTITCFVCLI